MKLKEFGPQGGCIPNRCTYHMHHGIGNVSLWMSDLGTEPPLPQTSNLGSYTPKQYWHLVVATETPTVGKRRAVCYLLECCLVENCFHVQHNKT